MSHYILSIDIGTTSAKALAVQADGTVLFHLHQFYPTFYPQSGFAEQTPAEIFRAVELLIAHAKEQSKQEPMAIVLSCAMHGLMAVDEKGNALTNLIIWSDTRSKAEARSLKASAEGVEIYQQTGTPIHPMSPLCKLMWLKNHQQSIFKNAFKFISIKEYIVYHWTGEFIIDYSLASATGLFNSQTLRWSQDALRCVSVLDLQLSLPVSPRHSVKFLPSVAKRLGISDQIPLVVGASDGCLAQLGSSAMNKGDMTLTLGTSGAVRVCTQSFTVDPLQRTFTYLLEPNKFISGGSINSGTAVMDWFAREFNSISLTDMVDQVKHLPAGCEGLVSLPHLLGERAPYYSAEARGVFFGVTVHHTSRYFQRALLEGICYQLRSVVEVMEELHGRQKKILVSGGIIRSHPWLQMLSDVLGRELTVQKEHDASALGAAYLAFDSLDVSILPTQQPIELLQPNLENHQAHDNAYVLFQKLNRQLQPLFDA